MNITSLYQEHFYVLNNGKQSLYLLHGHFNHIYFVSLGPHGRDRMVVGFITTYPISAYHN